MALFQAIAFHLFNYKLFEVLSLTPFCDIVGLFVHILCPFSQFNTRMIILHINRRKCFSFFHHWPCIAVRPSTNFHTNDAHLSLIWMYLVFRSQRADLTYSNHFFAAVSVSPVALKSVKFPPQHITTFLIVCQPPFYYFSHQSFLWFR